LNLKQERLFTGAFLFCICLQLAQSVHTAWFIFAGRSSQNPADLFSPAATLYAPDAYRVAIPALIRFASRTFRIHDRSYIAAALDFIAGLLALYLLYLFTMRPRPAETETPNDRRLRILIFLAVLQFPITWVVPWQRPETLPSTLYLAFSLFALNKLTSSASWLLAIAAATICQSFVRADVPLIFGIAIVIAALLTVKKSSLVAGRTLLFTGALITLISGAIQAWLQFVRYPHLTYTPGTNPIQLASNFTVHPFETFTIALLPFLAFLFFLLVKRPVLAPLDKVIVVSFLLYLPLWFTVGVVAEVRIDVPFQFALSTVFARVSALYLSREAAS
jgi:hypothetical protein